MSAANRENLPVPGRKHRHHFMPVFQLRYFADPESGRVWVHDRRQRLTPNPKSLMPVSIGSEEDLYTAHSPEGGKSDTFENWLAEVIDGPAAAAFPKLLDNQPMTKADRADIARYVMSRDLRTPRAQKFIVECEQQAADAAWSSLERDIPDTRARILADGGIDFSEEEICYYLDTLGPAASNNAFLSFMTRHLDGGARRLYHYSWLLVRPLIGQHYITSDLGIVKFRKGFGNPVDNMIGWIARADGWVMPLTPQAALVMAPGGDAGVAIATSDFLTLVNSSLAAQADALAFSRTPQTWILRGWGIDVGI